MIVGVVNLEKDAEVTSILPNEPVDVALPLIFPEAVICESTNK